MKYKLVQIKKSDKQEKKYMATFQNVETGRYKTTYFGSSPYSDFIHHKSLSRKNSYIRRHSRNEDWTDPTRAGTLSRYILWNKKTLTESIRDYKKRFNL